MQTAYHTLPKSYYSSIITVITKGYESDIPAKKTKAGPYSRLLKAEPNTLGSAGSQKASPEGQEEADSLGGIRRIRLIRPMLAKKYRLPVQSLAGKKGASVRGRYFLLKIFPATSQSRFAVTVSKRVYAGAAKRNWLRRIVFEYVRQQPLRAIHDYLVVAEPAAATLKTKDDIIKELTSIFKQYL